MGLLKLKRLMCRHLGHLPKDVPDGQKRCHEGPYVPGRGPYYRVVSVRRAKAFDEGCLVTTCRRCGEDYIAGRAYLPYNG